MTSARRVLAITLFLVCAPHRTAQADWLVTPFVGMTFGSDTNILDLDEAAVDSKFAKWMFGGTVSLLSDGVLGVEADFGYSPRYFQREGNAGLVTGSTLTTFMGNLVVAAPLQLIRYSLRPFVSGGVGLVHLSIDTRLDVLPIRSNLLGLDVGGGVIGFFSDNRGLRLDLRYFKSINGEEESITFGGTPRLHFWRASAGFVLKY